VDTAFFQHCALQLAPNGKIYTAKDTTLNCISNPNLFGSACGYIYQALSLSGRHAFTGLPTFFNRLVTNQNVDFTYAMLPDCKTVTFYGTAAIPGSITWNWNFGDNTFGAGQTVTHTFPSIPNDFTVTLTVNNAS